MSDVSISELITLVNTLIAMDLMGYLKLAAFLVMILLFLVALRKIRGAGSTTNYYVTNNYYGKEKAKK